MGPDPGRAHARTDRNGEAEVSIGELVELLAHSPDRAIPFCPVFGTCGGCQVQHVAYQSQLRWKRSLVANALQRLGGIKDARVGLPIGMDVPRAYRNKMALVVDHAGATPAFGFYAARSHDVVRIEACPIVLPQLDGAIGGLRGAAADDASAPSFDGAQHVVARAGRSSGEAVVAVTTGVRSAQLAERAAALAAHLSGVVGVVNSYEPPSENAVMGRKQATAFGRAEIEEAIDDVRFLVSPASFFQVNSEMVGKIFSFIAPHLQGLRSIVDLYCGAGTFSLFFAKHGARVVGIEENPQAVREARANAKMNGLEGKAVFLAGRVDATLRSKSGIDARYRHKSWRNVHCISVCTQMPTVTRNRNGSERSYGTSWGR